MKYLIIPLTLLTAGCMQDTGPSDYDLARERCITNNDCVAFNALVLERRVNNQDANAAMWIGHNFSNGEFSW